MKKTGIFYAINTKKTNLIGKEIQEAFGENKPDIIPLEEASTQNFENYDNLVLGVSTWFDGELPSYWDELLPEIENLKMKGKKVAIFGLGDQVGYPENFVDGIGILANLFERNGSTIVGYTLPDEYEFEKSLALREGKFLGLVLDEENQKDLTSSRILAWVKNLKKEFS
ncbi:MAG: flavodoxin [Massilibacteroides sp.]|nr:flavodoxin [Massilibacteroides sp.]MDD3061202.1 flavodoxin [Massilibacteroides sp.]MDD4115571.1 flavodoxin [Massilibacteroides sp.]MDD4661096.1 flavodoxin [Massilibacteroides sp.]